jgi:sec-independent protein translocase protein TatB
MFLDIGWSEMAIILLVALIVIGPKDLPRVARNVGRWSAKARSMARDFQRSLEDMAREAELHDIKSELNKVRPENLQRSIRDTVDPEGDMERAFDMNEHGKPALTSSPAKPQVSHEKDGEAKPHAETVEPKEPVTAEASKGDDKP